MALSESDISIANALEISQCCTEPWIGIFMQLEPYMSVLPPNPFMQHENLIGFR